MTVALQKDKTNRRFTGLSIDPKPTLTLNDVGDEFYETDTPTRWIWYGESWSMANHKDFFMDVAKGEASGHTALRVSGHDDSIGTTLATVGLETGAMVDHSTIADIDSISSDNTGDTHDITI